MKGFRLLLVLLPLAGCASFSTDGETVLYESINRDSVLVRFTSEPAGARTVVFCEGENSRKERTITTPANVRLPLRTTCTASYFKPGFISENVDFDPADFADPSALNPNPSCGDAGVWCTEREGLTLMVVQGVIIGLHGLAARLFDPVRQGRGAVAVVLRPAPESHEAEERLEPEPDNAAAPDP